MKKLFLVSVLFLSSSLSMASYVALTGSSGYDVKELITEPSCEIGSGITRVALDSMILNDEDVTTVCTIDITDFSFIFSENASFNQDISKWNVSNGSNFSSMFSNASSFNKNISNWNVSNGLAFANMFNNANVFNQDISSWNVSNGRDFNHMFSNAHSFNKDLGSWNVVNGENFYAMFWTAIAFNQNISAWDVTKATNWVNFKTHSGLSTSNTPPKFR